MPHDSTTYAPQVETKPIDRLIEALRGPEPKWWDFRDCRCCAIEVGVSLGLLRSDVVKGEYVMFGPLHFGMTDEQHWAVFGCVNGTSADPANMAIRPRHVAAALEHYRDTGIALSPFHFVQQERSNAV